MWYLWRVVLPDVDGHIHQPVRTGVMTLTRIVRHLTDVTQRTGVMQIASK